MNAFAGCNKNHFPVLASPMLPTLCLSPGGEDNPAWSAGPVQTQLWAKHGLGAETSLMKGSGSSCLTELSAAVSCSPLSFILPKTSQAFCSLTLLHTDVQTFIKECLPGLPSSNMNNQISLKRRCSETWKRPERKRRKLWFGA